VVSKMKTRSLMGLPFLSGKMSEECRAVPRI